MDPGSASLEDITRLDSRDKIAASSGQTASKTYSRDTLLRLRDSKLVGIDSVLEGELYRYLSPHYQWNEHVNKARAEEVHEGSGIRKEEGWRTVNPKQRPNGVANSPPNYGAHSWLLDDGSVSASPDRNLVGGNGPHRAAAAGWRRQNDLRNDHIEEPRRQPLGRGTGRGDHGDRQQASSAGSEDAWRPAPPGLGRNMQRLAPPGLSASDLPWGAGRGRLADGERRVSGKPRDPPGVMPPHEQSRDPQLPEGWNKIRERSQVPDWRTGKAKETMLERHSDTPAWLTAADTEDFESLSQSADSKRMEFEAEHNKLRSEREAAQAKHVVEEIGLDEIEAMKQQSLAEELAAQVNQRASRPSSRPTSRPASRPHSIIGFDMEGAGGDSLSLQGLAQSSQQSQDQPGSRFSRFFQLDPSASTSNLPNMMQDPALVPQQAPVKQPSQPLPGIFGGQGPQEVSQLQSLLTSRPPSAAGSVGSELSAPQRNLLAQLQSRNSGNFSQSLQQAQQPGSAQMTKEQMNRFLMEKNLLSPRVSTLGAPGGGLPRAGSQQSGGQLGGQSGSQLGGQMGGQFNQAPPNNLLSLLQSQQALRTQESNVSQLSGSAEPTFANPHPTQQQQQNLLNVLSMGDQQQQGGGGLSNNLIEQLQRMKLANEQQQQQQQLQQHFQQQQQQQQQQGQGQNTGLLAAFSAHMPRDSGTPKQLPEDLFSFNPNHQLNRLQQPSLQQQPASLGLGKNDRIPPTGPQGSNPIAHLLQAQQANQARGGLGQQPPAGLSNGLYNLQQQGNAQNSLSQLAQLRGLAAQKPPGQNSLGFSGLSQPNQLPQAGMMGQATQPLGSADSQQIARYLEQQRQAQVLQQVAQQQQQARLINTQRLYAMQLQQQQQQQQQRAAQAALLLQQQQLQQQLAALPQNRLSNEALLRQQQLLQLQNLQMSNNSNNNQGVGGNILNTAAGDPNALARLFANSGPMNNLPGRQG